MPAKLTDPSNLPDDIETLKAFLRDQKLSYERQLRHLQVRVDQLEDARR